MQRLASYFAGHRMTFFFLRYPSSLPHYWGKGPQALELRHYFGLGS
jgi:hypothetical protein